MEIIEINESQFEEKIINSKKPVLVDFFASWCGPCKMLAPVLKQVAEEMGDKVEIYKIDIDENEEIALRYSIMSIPTLLIFKNGEIKDKTLGFQNKREIVGFIQKNL